MAAARPTLQDPEARRVARDVGEKKSQAARLERALQAEQGKDPGEQRPERILELTRELAQTKAEYLTQAHAFLARYPRTRRSSSISRRWTQGAGEVRRPAALRDAGRPVLRRARHALPLRRRAGRQLPGAKPGGRAEGSLQAGPGVPAYLERPRPSVCRGSTTARRSTARGGAAPEVSRKLRRLLEPVEPELATHNLVLIPNDMLLYLPIHALTLGGDGSVRFLVETHVVSYVTQLELVDLLTPRSGGERSRSWPWPIPTAACRRPVARFAISRGSGRGPPRWKGRRRPRSGSSAWPRSSPTSTSPRTGCSTPSGPSAPICCWPGPTRQASG